MAGDWQAVRRLWPAVSEYRGKFVGALVANLLAQVGTVVAAVSGAWLAGQAVSVPNFEVFSGHALLLVWVIGFCVLVVAGCTYWEMYVAHDLAYVVLASLRVRLFDRLRQTLPSRTASRRSGDLSSTAVQDIESLEWIYAHVFAQIFVAGVIVTGGLTGVALIDPEVLWVAIPAALALMSVPWWLRRIADRQGHALRAGSAALTSEIVDTIQGLPELAAAGALPRRRKALFAQTRDLNAVGMSGVRRSAAEGSLTELLVSGAAVLSLLVLMLGVRDGRVDAAAAPVVLALVGAVLAPAAGVAVTLRDMGVLRASATRIFALMDAPDSAPQDPKPQPLGKFAGAVPMVEFVGVEFGYRQADPVLTGVSFSVHQGEVVALVGHSGAGKSTAMSLLQRFWDPDNGQILLNGTDIRYLADNDLRAAVSAVPQDVDLFADSLAGNVRLGRPEATDAQVLAVVQTAQLGGFVTARDHSLEMMVGERGVTLSGGQRARVAIARALLVEPSVLILDEAVANLDTTSELELAQAMQVGKSGRATLIIAHRRSTIARADRVIVLGGGKVLEQGSFDELMHGESALRSLLNADEVSPS
ncbi:ABC transporter ATP-binding protein [Nakamurella antarctica]|uniref:ABC transporter ATP-binding protein n=1 Tax=Nakamurella antarctica TaxID=1902245 RepID=A0A3G8ZQ96_9ACTN|nr:ABC transporter ATP-binding protein [Nakamurella antarctica]AZI58967.1 ABC transporter ATP-binding protein [Nakamurella antarctica]